MRGTRCLALAALLALASGVLVTAFLSHDFSLAYVAEHSNRAMPRRLRRRGLLQRHGRVAALLGDDARPARQRRDLHPLAHEPASGSPIAAQLLPGFIA